MAAYPRYLHYSSNQDPLDPLELAILEYFNVEIRGCLYFVIPICTSKDFQISCRPLIRSASYHVRLPNPSLSPMSH